MFPRFSLLKAVSALALTAMLCSIAGCTSRGAVPPTEVNANAGQLSTSGSGTDVVLYRFRGGMDGSFPLGALAESNGVLYGTTSKGGGSTCANSISPPGCGTVFKIGTSGSGYQVMHRFPRSAIGGAVLIAGVTNVGHTLYGTTQWGGRAMPCQGNTGCGSVFKLQASGNGFKILHAFSGNDGFAVTAGVVGSGNALYGETLGGGAAGVGTVFRVSTTGKFATLYNFAGGSDGDAPDFTPIVVNNEIYGTTAAGGGSACTGAYGSGCGTIYKIGVSGSGYRVLYRFKGGTDGAFPNTLLYVGGMLYGVTGFGGNTTCSFASNTGCGIIFRISPSGGGYRVLHRFSMGSNGWSPTSLLADAKGTLYGATSFGGNTSCTNGCGTIFQMSTSGGGYRALYRFTGGMDGANPGNNGPIDVNGTLFGTTAFGGGSGCGGKGCGTVFGFTP